MLLSEMCDRNPVSFSTAVITWPVIADQIRSDQTVFFSSIHIMESLIIVDLKRAWLRLLMLVLENLAAWARVFPIVTMKHFG